MNMLVKMFQGHFGFFHWLSVEFVARHSSPR
jgi:hypothetical protein